MVRLGGILIHFRRRRRLRRECCRGCRRGERIVCVARMGVQPPIITSDSGAPLWSSGSMAGGGQRAGLPPGEPMQRTARMPRLPSVHEAARMSPDDTAQRTRLPSIHMPARTPPRLPAWWTARMRPVNSRLLTRHARRVAAPILFFRINSAALYYLTEA
jgi:hypothetical protein